MIYSDKARSEKTFCILLEVAMKKVLLVLITALLFAPSLTAGSVIFNGNFAQRDSYMHAYPDTSSIALTTSASEKNDCLKINLSAGAGSAVAFGFTPNDLTSILKYGVVSFTYNSVSSDAGCLYLSLLSGKNDGQNTKVSAPLRDFFKNTGESRQNIDIPLSAFSKKDISSGEKKEFSWKNVYEIRFENDNCPSETIFYLSRLEFNNSISFKIPLTEPGTNMPSSIERYSVMPQSNDNSRGSVMSRNIRPLTVIKEIPGMKINGASNKAVRSEPVELGGKKGPRGQIFLGFDSDKLYIFADIDGVSPGPDDFTGEDIINGDSLEFFFGTNPGSDPDRDKYEPTDIHIALKASKDLCGYNFTKKSAIDHGEYYFRKKNNGYILEASLPLSDLGAGCLCRLKNRDIGFDCALNFKQKGGTIISRIRWTGTENINKDPSEWGRIRFSTK
jgi:hypothetical protein